MKKDFFVKILAVAMTVLAVFSAVPVSFAANTFSDETSNSSDGLSLGILDAELWESSKDNISCTNRTAAGKRALYVSAGTAETQDFTISTVPDNPLDLAGAKELAADISISSAASCTLTLTVISDGNEISGSIVSSGSGTCTVYTQLDRDNEKIDEIRLRVQTSSDTSLHFSMTDLYSDALFSYSYKDLFMAKDVTIEAGSPIKTEKSIEIVSSTEKTILGMEFNYNSASSVSAVYVTISGAAAGSVSVEAELESVGGTGEASPVLTSSAQALYPGTNTYCFIVYSEFSAVRFSFEGISAEKDSQTGHISVTGAGAMPADSLSDADSTSAIGSVTSCKSNESGAVTINGTLSSDAAVKYINASLGLFVIPVWEDIDTAFSGSPVATANISTKFSFTVTTDIKYTLCIFKVAIISDSGAISVGNAVFADNGTAAVISQKSVAALHCADTAGVFESNVSSVIIDVYAGELLENEDIYSAHLYSFSGNYYYFDADYINSVDKRVKFSLAAGNTVLLRLLSGSSEDAPAFDYSPFDSGSATLMCAISEYLAKRYQGCSGFIMGPGVNLHDATPSEAKSTAYLAAMFTETVKSNCPGALSVVPFTDENNVDPAVFSAILAYYMNNIQSGTAALMYSSGTASDYPVYTVAHLVNSFGTFGIHSADGCLSMWRVPDNMSIADIISSYKSMCNAAGASGVLCAVMSVSEKISTPDLFGNLKTMLDYEDIFSASITQSQAQLDEISFTGSYGLWDFRESYDASGWISGGAFGDCITSPASNRDTRVLKSACTPGSNKSGVLVSWLGTPINASETTMQLDLSMISDTAGYTDISVIIGSGNARDEFSASVENNKPTVLSCDISGFSGSSSVEYVALIVRGSSAADMEISTIKLCSNTKTSDEMKTEYMQTTKNERDPAIYIIIGFIAAATLTIWSLLLRKKPKSPAVHEKKQNER